MSKVFVEVTAKFDKDGKIEPLQVAWTDGTRYPVDKVVSVCRAVSTGGGGIGLRYTCRICGKSAFVFYSDRDHRWFVEGKGGTRSDWVYTII